MKATELRIGNWFIQYDEPEQFDGDFYHLSDIKFIPLTEEWLLKLGFKEVSDRIYVKNYHYGYEFGITNYFVIKNGKHFIRYKHIKYIHQLQNLYFALTNEELKHEP